MEAAEVVTMADPVPTSPARRPGRQARPSRADQSGRKDGPRSGRPGGTSSSRSASPSTLGRRSGPGSADESRVALLAAETLSLIVRSCSTSPAVRTLQRMAGRDPGLLRAASARCRQVTALDAQIRRAAADLLLRAAADLGSGSEH